MMTWNWGKRGDWNDPAARATARRASARQNVQNYIDNWQAPRSYPASPESIANVSELAGPQEGNNWLEHQMAEAGIGWGDVIKFGLAAIPGVWDRLTKSPREQMIDELFAERAQRLEDTRRRARGQLTGSETQDILNNPALNRIVANVAQAGLEGSGAGQQILSDATIGAFDAAQDRAVAQLDALELGTFDLVNQFYQEDDDFAGLTGQFLALFQQEQVTGQYDEMTQQINSLLTQLTQAFANIQTLQQQMLNPSPAPQ